MEVSFIRHSKTLGNIDRKYIGTTDENLSSEGINLAMQVQKQNLYPECEVVVISPMKRCEQTKNAIYPKVNTVVVDDLRECDFGDFENKNYEQLKDNEDYQKWLDSEGKMPFPNGESHIDFIKRCTKSFAETCDKLMENGVEKVAFIVHGGTIMSIMQKFCRENGKKDFYDFQVKNCEGYVTQVSKNKKNNIRIKVVKEVVL